MIINFKKVKISNFLSIGKEPVIVDITNGLNIIVGKNLDKNRSNGSGKCVRGSTSVDILIENEEILKKFKEFNNK